jgi:hypothetical protein
VKRKRLVVTVLGLAGALFCWFVTLPRLISSRGQLGPDAVAILDDPFRAEVVRLAPQDGQWEEDSLPFGGFTASSAPVILDNETKSRVRALAFDWRSLAPQSSACLIEPGVGFRFSATRGTVEILVCFKCDQILVISRDQNGKVKNSVLGEFGGMRREWSRVVKDLYPADAEIQALAD